MSYDGPTEQQFTLLQDIQKAEDGYKASRINPACDQLRKQGYVTCRRSDNDCEWWWLSEKGTEYMRHPAQSQDKER